MFCLKTSGNSVGIFSSSETEKSSERKKGKNRNFDICQCFISNYKEDFWKPSPKIQLRISNWPGKASI